MSGTDKTKAGHDLAGPVVILVEPQLGENIGMAARAMGNFALTRMRIVNPRDGWPNVAAQRAAAGADHIIGSVELFDTVEQAIADLTLVFATTARAHDQAKPVVGPEGAANEIVGHVASGGGAGILFGRERSGLTNEEVALANRIITFPVNPGFASLNLAQAVLLMGYEWFKLSTAGALPFAMPERSEPASQHQMQAFFDNLVAELDKVEFLRPAEKRDTMLVNLRNIFTRMDPTKQDMHTLHGVVMAIAEGRKGPAKGGVLDGAQATRLRALLAEQGQGGAAADNSSTVRGLARLLRRNPTDAERIVWQALTRDRRFAGQFKRQTPVGRHIPDFVSFVHRLAIELVNAGESDAIAADRANRRAWLEARDYRVVDMQVADVERDLDGELARLEGSLQQER
ncbi:MULTISPECIES: TrmJ/YjtD family RNA methyltransferase [unclassified Bradyrhizobium]|uniref:TrmJ/YjtD family RNA methyltransferase n=1 Tax=unclassified Bradyrhizobium TaxID=2631580 RepID=UPI001BA9D90C|nr:MULTISPECIES: TrmJ/YjtD family RNA methyltransferase [unclassified Bradyrhizobium]MBR1204194.1 TrmJ/YjtD family RNA methyltransferase [Bradyrhizobium sp. AUGA SZCCT0124]MBR1309920.1 TrmJ/YjtD family RNA methyltransferase [Bradyrhizobium sp. AUGA SZCCT0051]MBR1340061.1 TrmJ/YjtD family RNA methyltransferase [Bradyrhizobium sp. AUGA SZCCT0105]MBR1354668.1 TrmJ/YjtD family RNA methyltransferase [Bradyrhizobium sp. AUGA SZCCT0045]